MPNVVHVNNQAKKSQTNHIKAMQTVIIHDRLEISNHR